MAVKEPAARKSYDTKSIVSTSVKICTANGDRPFKAPVLHEQFTQHLRSDSQSHDALQS